MKMKMILLLLPSGLRETNSAELVLVARRILGRDRVTTTAVLLPGLLLLRAVLPSFPSQVNMQEWPWIDRAE
jgi:hypothetical protein